MKLIGLDVGTRRIGVAIADSGVRIAVPNTTVTVNNGLEYTEIARIARANNTVWFVVGMPRSNEGNTTNQSRYVKQFAKSLSAAVPGAKIRFQDESLTSVEAENRLKARKKSYRREEIDAEAAAIILQDFIEHIPSNLKDGNETNIAPSSGKLPKRPTISNKSLDIEVPKKENKVRKEKSKKSDSYSGHVNPSLKRFVIILCIIVGLGGIGAFAVFSWYNSSLKAVYDDIDCGSLETDSRCDFIDFSVRSGESLSVISDNLESSGIIRNSFVFQVYMRSHNLDNQIKVGDYQFRRTMDVEEIGKQLIEGAKNPNVFSFTILPGETVSSIKKNLARIGYSDDEINEAFSKDYRTVNKNLDTLLSTVPTSKEYGAEPLEGFLFGDTYEFYKKDPVEKIVVTALNAFWDVVEGNDLIRRFEQRGLTLYQGVTLASIIQKEAKTLDQPTVAQVFYSRLSQNLQLGSDVTLSYALDLVDPNRETYKDNGMALDLDNPYNTRRYIGLPPGPICNPGVSALLAVANPTDTSYLYFLTGDDGVMYYSYTEEEHNQNIVDHCRNLCGVQL